MTSWLVASSTSERFADDGLLEGFWASDIWLMRACPLGVGQGVFRFGGLTPQLSDELKLAVRAKLMAKEWSLQTQHASLVNRIVVWLAMRHSTSTSMLDRSIESWTLDLQGHLLEQGLLRQPMRRQLSRVQEELRSPARDPTIVILRSLYAKLLVLFRPPPAVPEFAKDVWDVRRMGVVGSPLHSDYSLSFVKLTQPWLRTAAKHFVRHTIVTTSYRNAKGRLGALKRFSAYLAKVRPGIEPHAVDRSLMVAYLAHIHTLGMAPATIGVWLVALRSFFELCAREGWATVPERTLVYREDFPRQEHPLPRFIAEDVLQQLNAHLNDLRPVYRRLTLMLEECGMRISEACSLPLECLSRDPEGDYFLRYHQPKMRKELQIPISRALATTIQEQQRAVHEQWGAGLTWLLPNRKGGPVTPRGYRVAINELAYRHRVRDATGALFRVHPHGFRHTVGTRMINNDVPQRVVQQFLGHESPSMTARYAHIHDATMKRKLAEYRGKVVDITGKVVEGAGPPISSDALWLKRNILAQALPNGVCRLPIQQGECPHANACLTCVHFGTSGKYLAVLKEQLVQTDRILETAHAQRWTRQAEMNQRVRQNLLTVISTLEGGRSSRRGWSASDQLRGELCAAGAAMSRRRAGHERNIDGLRAASALKHQEAERKVDSAIRALLRAGETITFRRVATVAGVTTGWLYAQPVVKEQITRLRGQPVDKTARPAERASEASKDAIVRALRQRVNALDNERQHLLARIVELQQRIEVLYGELYAKRVDSPYPLADAPPRSTS